MARLNERVARLETHLTPAPMKEIRLLAKGTPEFDQKMVAAKEAGADVIVLVPVVPPARHETH